MREIKFRGKDRDTGEWVYGNLLKNRHTSRIVESDHVITGRHKIDCFHNVDPSTVGQFIGYPDDNDNPICEDDKIQILYTDWPSQTDYSISLEDYKKSISKIGKVFYVGGAFRLIFDDGSVGDLNPGVHGERYIIGNIHDNPELLS